MASLLERSESPDLICTGVVRHNRPLCCKVHELIVRVTILRLPKEDIQSAAHCVSCKACTRQEGSGWLPLLGGAAPSRTKVAAFRLGKASSRAGVACSRVCLCQNIAP